MGLALFASMSHLLRNSVHARFSKGFSFKQSSTWTYEMSLIEVSTAQTMTTKRIAEDVGYDDDLFASLSTEATSSSSSSMGMTGMSIDTAKDSTRWMVDCIQPDFEGMICHVFFHIGSTQSCSS